MAKKKTIKSEATFFESLGQAAEQLPGGWRDLRFGQWNPLVPGFKWVAGSAKKLNEPAGKAWRILIWPFRKKWLWLGLLIGLGATVVATAGFAVVIARSTFATYDPNLTSPLAIVNNKAVGTTILDRNGNLLFRTYGAANREAVYIDTLPANLTKATLAAEDPTFYNHSGFSWRATSRAVLEDVLRHDRSQGGSTITQQLIKNTLLTPQKSFVRKYQEILLSIRLEQRYSKKDILQMYLNTVYYGEGAYGVQSAAETYFHKPAKDLTLAESAMLAGLPLGPSRFDPNLDPNAALDRRNFVIDRMQQLHLASDADVQIAKAATINTSSEQIQIQAPHFVFYVLNKLREQYGDAVVEKGGITVYTTLDLNKQNIAQQDIQDQIKHLASHHVTNSGLVSIDPKTGDILAMVGSVDYNQPEFGKVNVTTARLQPGSSFKPFAYVTAFAKGWNGATTVQDRPISLPNGDGTKYVPKDYDGKWRGEVTLRRALSNSLNIPAIHVIQYAGIHGTIQTAHDLGITTLEDESRYGVSLVLGGGEVTPLDMAAAYAGFANNGVKVTPRSIIKVLDRTSKDITKPDTTQPTQAVSPDLAYMITNILSDNQSRTEEFGANSPLKLSRPAAAKTGTTNDFRDNWTVGYVPGLATAVWVGNNDHTPMNNVDGITGAAPIWHNYMESVLAGAPVENFNAPEGVVFVAVCTKDGGLANPWDKSIQEVFLKTSVPTKHCSTQAPQPPTPPDQPAPVDTTTPVATPPSPPPNGHKHHKT